MSMMKKTFSRLLLLLFVGGWIAGLAACSTGFVPSTVKEPGITLCETDADCKLQGQTCFRRYCRASNAVANHRYSIQLIPPSVQEQPDGKRLVRQQFLGIDISTIHDRAIWVRESFRVQGTVNDHSGAPVAALIRFIDRETIPGQSLSWETNNDARDANTSGASPTSTTGKFSINATFGVYDVEVIPDDKRLPPFRMDKVSISREQTLDIVFPQHHFDDLKKDGYIRLQGKLASTSSINKLPDAFDRSQLKVDALSESGRPISGIVPLHKDGSFLLRLQTTGDSSRLAQQPAFLRVKQVTKSDEKRDSLVHWVVPEIRIPIKTIEEIKDNTIQLGELPFLYCEKPAILSGTIRSRLQEGAAPCASCRVSVEGQMSMGFYKEKAVQGSFRFDVNTNSDGSFSIPHLDGPYELEIQPGVQSRWARAVFESSSISGRKMEIMLEPKKSLRGRVCSNQKEGEPCEKMVPGTQIQAVWRSARPGVSFSLGAPKAQSQTQLAGQDGSFEMMLDPGIYDLIFIPPAGSDLARKVKHGVEVANQSKELKALLPKAQFLIAQIIGPDGFMIDGMTVELYAFKEGSQEAAHLVGRHITNSAGLFSIPYDPTPLQPPKTQP